MNGFRRAGQLRAHANRDDGWVCIVARIAIRHGNLLDILKRRVSSSSKFMKKDEER
jgi:hypothetical protein